MNLRQDTNKTLPGPTFLCPYGFRLFLGSITLKPDSFKKTSDKFMENRAQNEYYRERQKDF